MRIDEINVGDELTDDRTHYAHDVRPRWFRVEALDRRLVDGRTRHGVVLVELDPDTDDAYPEGHMITRGTRSYSYEEPCRTGAFLAAQHLEPYRPAFDAWVAWTAAFAEVSATATSIREALGLSDDDRIRVRPVVAVTSEGLRPRVELNLTGDQARLLAERLA